MSKRKQINKKTPMKYVNLTTFTYVPFYLAYFGKMC